MNDIFWLITSIYLGMWAVAAYFLWRAFRVGIKNDLRFIKGVDGQPLRHRKNLTRPFALTELLTGIAVIIFLLAIPIFALPMRIWPAFILVIATTRQLQLIKFSRRNEP
jgi:hypothetical protein